MSATTDPRRLHLEETIAQATRDLAELEEQVATGEIDAETAAELRAAYKEERDQARELLAALGPSPDDEEARQAKRSRRRVLVGALILVAALGSVVFSVMRSVTDRANPALQGTAAAGPIDPDSVSNETLEAVIAANLDNPQINGMRFALADRYFEAGDYAKAFPHLQAILESDPPPELATATLVRLGWMVYDGNQEVELAASLIRQALDITPDYPLGLYLLARVEWCGAGDPAAAVPLLEQAMANPGLDSESRSVIEADLAVARAGGPCS